MKKRNLKIFGVALAVWMLTQSNVQAAAPCNASDQNIVTIKDLSFGDAGSLASPGSIDISATGFRSASGGVYLFGGIWSSAQFEIRGCPNDVITITLPVTGEVIRGAGGNKLTINNFVSIPSASSSHVLDATGILTLLVGASLQLNAYQGAGVYTGNINIDIVYN